MIRNRMKVLLAEKELREHRKITYQTMADETQIPKSVLSVYASQGNRQLNLITLEKICKYLQCTVADFLFMEVE